MRRGEGARYRVDHTDMMYFPEFITVSNECDVEFRTRTVNNVMPVETKHFDSHLIPIASNSSTLTPPPPLSNIENVTLRHNMD